MSSTGASETVHDGTGYVEPAHPGRPRRPKEEGSIGVKVGLSVLLVIVIVGIAGVLVCTTPWSKITVTIDNLAARPAHVSIFVDNELVADATVANFTEAWSVSFDVVYGTHVVSVNYIYEQPQAHELTRIIYVGPFSSATAYCVLLG